MFGIVQKKGDENRLSGKVIGYVRVSKPESESEYEPPFDALVSPDGILAIQGDYSKNPDFESFRNTMPRGLQEILKQILEDDDIRENFDKAKKISVSVFPKKGRMGDFFPVPAQMVQFQSEDILLNEDCDIYFLGEFSSLGSAHLFLTGFPILYQSKYREQTELENEKQVDELLSEIGGENPVTKEIESEQSLSICLEGNLSGYKGNLLELLGAQVLPKMMYAIEENDLENFNTGLNSFRRFMCTYPHQQDVEMMIYILQNINEKKHSNSSDSRSLALLCRKMSALHHEEFEILPAIQKELEELRVIK